MLAFENARLSRVPLVISLARLCTWAGVADCAGPGSATWPSVAAATAITTQPSPRRNLDARRVNALTTHSRLPRLMVAPTDARRMARND